MDFDVADHDSCDGLSLGGKSSAHCVSNKSAKSNLIKLVYVILCFNCILMIIRGFGKAHSS